MRTEYPAPHRERVGTVTWLSTSGQASGQPYPPTPDILTSARITKGSEIPAAIRWS